MDDFSSCCRLCLSSQEDNLDLFSPDSLKELIPQKILCVLSILVHPQDTLPQKICPSCVDLVKRFYKFHRTASRSLEHLLTLLEKDDDVDKVLYSKCQKNFRNKNYSHLTGNSNYEKLLQEKFNEVKASVDDVTSRFTIVQDFVPHIMTYGSQNNHLPPVHIPKLDMGACSQTPVAQAPTVSSEITVINISKGTVSKKAKVLNDKQLIQNKVTNRNTKQNSPKIPLNEQGNEENSLVKVTPAKKNTGKRSKKSSIIPKENEIETGIKTTLFRCKYCPCVYSTQKDLLDHDVVKHNAIVNVPKYYGPSHLLLEQDVNQVKKLSWPFRKQCYSTEERRKITENESKSLIYQFSPSKDSEDSPLLFRMYSTENNKRKRSLENDSESITQKDLTDNEVPKKRMKMGPKSRKLMMEMTDSSKNNALPTKKKVFVGPKSKNPKLKIHRLEKKYLENQCKFCECELESQAPTAFLTHLKVKGCNSINSNNCSLCRKEFSSRKESLKEHEKVCNLTQFFTQESKCTKCSLSVKKTLLKDHLSGTHQVLFKCFICSAAFNQENCLLDHFSKCSFRPSRAIVKSFACGTCKLQFETLTSLKKHTLQSHTHHYLNEDIALNYDERNQWVEKKSTSNILPYKRNDYMTCNTKGDFFCNIKTCKKKLNSIFELETHIQEHTIRVKKRGRAKKKGKGRTKKSETKNTYSRMSICDTYLLKLDSIDSADTSHLVKETSIAKSKDDFLSYLGLNKHSGDKTSPHEVPQGVFELSDNANASAYTAYNSSESFAIDKRCSPELLTIDSDDD